ncbi:MAG: hypothetical protein ACREI1_14810 [Nitrospiraceae bacterium]
MTMFGMHDGAEKHAVIKTRTLLNVGMLNRDGFVPAPRPDVLLAT